MGNKKVEINRRDYGGEGVGDQEAQEPNWSIVSSAPNGINEDYDAVDLQNIALAETDQSVASYHRAKIIDDWVEWYRDAQNLSDTNSAQQTIYKFLQSNPNNLSGNDLKIVKQLRRASLRPFAWDHSFFNAREDFTGKTWANATQFFNLLKGNAFDVDADGDGQLDSVWLDFGQEPFRLSDGRFIKPLAAIRCIDLGGRVNVNAHGSLAHMFGNSPRTAFDSQPVGLGYGPADVRLDAVLTNQEIDEIFLGKDQSNEKGNQIYRRLAARHGRYGGGVPPSNNPEQLPGSSNDEDNDDTNSAMGLVNSKATLQPTDYWSRYSIGLENGHPRFETWYGRTNDRVNSPYELNLFDLGNVTPFVPLDGATRDDQPFAATELESILRTRDPDNASLLPQRLLGTFLHDLSKLNLITTESWDTPAIIGDIPANLGGSNLEIKRGLKLNLNRPFGDRIDNDNDSIVDEPDETTDPYFISNASGWNLTRGQTISNQPGRDVAGLRSRQIMANNLFQLMLNLQSAANLPYQNDGLDNDLDGDIDERDEILITIRELAQWAVNVVDYIDSDAIMTPFKYGSGILPDEDVVWGCESPDLIVTETIAFHNRGIADTDISGEDDANEDEGTGTKTTDGNSPRSDEDFDQIKLPQGSVFVELHAVRDRDAESLPKELYSKVGGKWNLDLGRKLNNSTAPVWRLSFSELAENRNENNDPFAILHDIDPANLNTEADLNFRPTDASDAEKTYSHPRGIATDRYVYFTAAANLDDFEIGKSHKPNRFNTFRPSAAVSIQCGDYLVAGPRSTTYFGGTEGNDEYSKQVINVQSGGVQIRWLDESVDSTLGFPESKGVVLVADSPPHMSNHEIGLNISEPVANQYLENQGQSYYPSTTLPTDSPFDYLASSPLADVESRKQGTHFNESTVFVERLADPTRPYEPDAESTDWNPYIVVDFMPIDLTVFNGESSDPDPNVGSDKKWYVQTRQRGFDAWIDQKQDGKDVELFSRDKALNDPTNAVFSENPWRPCSPWEKNDDTWQERPPQPEESTEESTDAYFKYDIGASYDDWVPTHTLGWCNLSQGKRNSGYPSRPFSWIVWKDGPLANPYELLMVPRTSASRLLTDYRDVGSLTDADKNNTNADGDPAPFGVDESQPFGATRPGHHLLPLTSITDRPVDKDNPVTPVSDSLSRLFGYVRTPSPFVGVREELTGDNLPTLFRPPFNQTETYREPGRINVNTIRDPKVWGAILGDQDPDNLVMEPSWADMKTDLLNSTSVGTASGQRRGAETNRSTTLFADADKKDGQGDPIVGEPLFSTPANSDSQFDPEHSSWFRFGPLIRASANTTARSEVYAIWVTVGLFEVEPVGQGLMPAGVGPAIEAYPSGYKILQEYGSSSGDMKRYRGFYIFDRSRAICYDPGVDHNVDEGILIERFVE
ncbi:MAG: hypothetical protein ACR2NF_01320 [Pirellulales bacterium]